VSRGGDRVPALVSAGGLDVYVLVLPSRHFGYGSRWNGHPTAPISSSHRCARDPIIYPLGVILSTNQIGPGHQGKYRLTAPGGETVVRMLTRPNLTLIIRVCLFFGLFQADVAQSVEQLICNQQVRGSIPLVSSVAPTHPECCEHKPRSSVRRGCVSDEGERRLGGVTEWLMVADCKSAGLTPYVGSNPTPTIR
jgi:hypothetical protein